MKTETNQKHVDWIKRDLLVDAEQSEKQAQDGPFFPGVTKETLLKYAAECRALIARRDWTAKQFIEGKV